MGRHAKSLNGANFTFGSAPFAMRVDAATDATGADVVAGDAAAAGLSLPLPLFLVSLVSVAAAGVEAATTGAAAAAAALSLPLPALPLVAATAVAAADDDDAALPVAATATGAAMVIVTGALNFFASTNDWLNVSFTFGNAATRAANAVNDFNRSDTAYNTGYAAAYTAISAADTLARANHDERVLLSSASTTDNAAYKGLFSSIVVTPVRK